MSPGNVLAVALLIGMTVLVHAGGVRSLLWLLVKHKAFYEVYHNVFVNTFRLTWVIGILILLHLGEIVMWALFYHWKNLFPDLETAIYYSFLTYTTVGYGDVVLPKWWRVLGASEALLGILMTAWSTAILVGVVQRLKKALLDRFEHPESGATDD